MPRAISTTRCAGCVGTSRCIATQKTTSGPCLGNSLARLELRVMFEELLRRFPDLALATSEAPPLRPANFVVGIEALPLHLSPVRRPNSARS
jgi:hypothetical protein